MQNVLLIEDDPWIAQLLTQVVAGLWPGAQIEHTQDLRRGLNRIKQQPPDLLIADLNLPDGSGLEAIATQARLRPASQRILTTALTSRELVLQARKAGITGFIAKPFSLDNLIERLQQLSPAHTDAPAPVIEGGLSDYLAERLRQQLYLPVLAPFPSPEELPLSGAQLLECANLQPAFAANLLATANSERENNLANPCLSVAEALAQLGGDVANELLERLLRTSSQLQDDDLRALADRWQAQQLEMQRILSLLATRHSINPQPLCSAVSLSRLGELSLLCAVQNFRRLGQHCTLEDIEQALQQSAGEYGNQIKIRKAIPAPLRQLIGALFMTPRGTPGKGQLMMRLAAIEAGMPHSTDETAQLERLLGGI